MASEDMDVGIHSLHQQKNSDYSQDEKERIDKLYEEISAPQKVCGKLEDVKSKLEEMVEKQTNFSPALPSETFNSLSNEEKRRVLTIMKEQTKGISTLVATTKKNAARLETIEMLIDNIKQGQRNDSYYSQRYMF